MDTINSQQIQSLWIGGQLSKLERLCIQSFIDNGHDFHLYTYNELKNVPDGTKVLDASNIILESNVFVNGEGWGKGSYSTFADLFRLLLLQKNGGWWVDMDIICLKSFDFNEDLILGSSFESGYGDLAINCVIKAPRNSPFLIYCLNQIELMKLPIAYGHAGPFLFQKAVKELELEMNVYAHNIFNPIGWKNVGELILGESPFLYKLKEFVRPIIKPTTMNGRKITTNSYTVHFWNEMWRTNNFDKNGTYNYNCLFERLKRKHLIK